MKGEKICYWCWWANNSLQVFSLPSMFLRCCADGFLCLRRDSNHAFNDTIKSERGRSVWLETFQLQRLQREGRRLQTCSTGWNFFASQSVSVPPAATLLLIESRYGSFVQNVHWLIDRAGRLCRSGSRGREATTHWGFIFVADQCSFLLSHLLFLPSIQKREVLQYVTSQAMSSLIMNNFGSAVRAALVSLKDPIEIWSFDLTSICPQLWF